MKSGRGVVGRLIPFASVLLASALLSSSAKALNITGTLRYWDSRNQRSNNTGSQLTTATFRTNRPLANAYVLLMDKDGSCVDMDPGCGEHDDDFLDFDFTDVNGAYSWTGVVDLVDVYITYDYYEYSGDYVLDSTGTQPKMRSALRPASTGTLTLNMNATCIDEARNTVVGLCDNTADVASYFQLSEGYANLAASMDATEARVDPPNHMIGYWPDTPANNCTSPVFSAGVALGTSFCVTDAANNHTISHEMGHNLHVATLGIPYTALLTGGGCTSNQVWLGSDPEKCVTAEGYAHFVSGAVWWNQNATGPMYRGELFEGDTQSANGMVDQTCVSKATTPWTRKGNAARFFWDLYDSTSVGTNDGANDDETQTFAHIHAVWGNFPAGTANGQASETGANGRNIQDYLAHDADYEEVERDYNCLGSQAP
jgi:hypothetical protein